MTDSASDRRLRADGRRLQPGRNPLGQPARLTAAQHQAVDALRLAADQHGRRMASLEAALIDSMNGCGLAEITVVCRMLGWSTRRFYRLRRRLGGYGPRSQPQTGGSDGR